VESTKVALPAAEALMEQRELDVIAVPPVRTRKLLRLVPHHPGVIPAPHQPMSRTVGNELARKLCDRRVDALGAGVGGRSENPPVSCLESLKHVPHLSALH